MDRRIWLQQVTAGGLAIAASHDWLPKLTENAVAPEPWLKLAVQQYSFNRALKAGTMEVVDFPARVVKGTGIQALEYFNGHMEERAGDTQFFKELRKRTDDLNATNTLMLCRSKAALDSPEPKTRLKAIEIYKPWLEATRILGGKYIRVDVRSKGKYEAQKRHAIAGLRQLCDVAAGMDLGILVENHGGFSGNGKWVAEVMQGVERNNCGTLPDFQNFKDYDPYQGVAEMMPHAKVLCAKSKSFDEHGNETNVSFERMLKIAKDAGFQGYIGIEFEGHDGDPLVGIKATRDLILRIMENLS